MISKIKRFLNKKPYKYIFYIILIIIVVVLLNLIFSMFQAEHRIAIILSTISIVILPLVVLMFRKKLKMGAISIVLFISIVVHSITTLAYPNFSVMNLFRKKEVEDINTVHDEDLTRKTEENDAIETSVVNIDNDVFKKFYDLSFIENSEVKGEDSLSEELKIQTIIDMIVDNIEHYSLDRKSYTDKELNSGEYSDLTSEANKSEIEYKKVKDSQNAEINVACVQRFLQMRLNAYNLKKTGNLARLIGNTYVEMAYQQVANDSIISNCDAIKYYVESCHLSEPTEKSKLYYELGIRYNCIAETARDIYIQENSSEYHNLFVDSLYMSIAYYKLYRNSYIEDYKNNFYLARNYKMLGENMNDDSNKIVYFEKSLEILHTLEDYNDLSTKSKSSICNLIYNTLYQYKNIPKEHWKIYSLESLNIEMSEKQIEKNSTKQNNK